MFKFILYSLLGWGSSALITALVFITDHLAWTRDLDITLPGVGQEKCFLSDAAQGVYLHLPILVLMIINALLFITTSTTIYRSELQSINSDKSRINQGQLWSNVNLIVILDEFVATVSRIMFLLSCPRYKLDKETC